MFLPGNNSQAICRCFKNTNGTADFMARILCKDCMNETVFQGLRCDVVTFMGDNEGLIVISGSRKRPYKSAVARTQTINSCKVFAFFSNSSTSFRRARLHRNLPEPAEISRPEKSASMALLKPSKRS